MWWWWLAGCVVGFDQVVTIDEPVDRIEATVTAGDLTVRALSGPVEISGAFSGPSGGPVTGDLAGGTLTLTYDCTWCGGDLLIVAPPDTELAITLGEGDLWVDGMVAEIDASVDQGTVTLIGAGEGPVVLDVAVGGIDVSFSDKPWALTGTVSADGRISAGLPPGEYALDLHGGVIDVDPLVVDDATSANPIQLDAGAGSVSVFAVVDR